jgi:hypothetical protein
VTKYQATKDKIMGNRAVIQFGTDPTTSLGIYCHWNGGIESVKAFLDYAKAAGVGNGEDYTVARVAQIIGNFFGGTNSLGVGLACDSDRDNCDNGTYIIDKLTIVGREFASPDTWDPAYYSGVFAAVHTANAVHFGLDVDSEPPSDPTPPAYMVGPSLADEEGDLLLSSM